MADLHHTNDLPISRESHHMSDPVTSRSCADDCSSRRAFLSDALAAAATIAGLSALPPLATLHALSVSTAGTVRYPIPSADSVSIDTRDEVILCRANGEVYAFALSCPHQNTAIRALPGNKGFQCPRHKSRYQSNGTFVSGKATRNMDRLPITRDGDQVVVDTSVAFESDRQPEQWRAALVKLT